jgi:hypothetical protein
MTRCNLHRLLSLNSRQVWQLWLALACVAFAVHLLTLRISPTIWQDEVQIVEYGRTALWGSDLGWSINWLHQGRPIMTLSYLSCSLQELACRLSGVSEIGPRVSSVLGAVLAGTFLLGWLIKRGHKPFVSFLAATLLLLDPVFAQSYRGARVDSWVFALIFLTCWLIWRSSDGEARQGRFDPGLVVAGVCLALAGLCWPSAALLIPLVLHELIARHPLRFSRAGVVAMLPVLFTLAASAALTVLLFLAPVWSSVWTSFKDVNSLISVQSDKPSLLSIVHAIADDYRLSPWVFALGALGFVLPSNRLLGVAFLAAAFGVILTDPYIHRALYLLPYMLLSLTGLMTCLMQQKSHKPAFVRAFLVGLALLLLWSAGLTLGGRTWNAWRQREARSPDRIMEVAKGSIGARKVSVFTPCWEFYYAGRRLGWRQFNLTLFGYETSHPLYIAFLTQMDFAILREGDSANPPVQSSLKQAGFVLSQRIQAGNESGIGGNAASKGKIGATGYGEYLVYARGATSPPGVE